jgi:protein-tyrosine phosphatase
LASLPVSWIDGGSTVTDTPLFSILTVCTGNICRSPLAAGHLATSLASISTITVSSAGTHALEGDTMPPEAVALGERAGVTTTGHRARLLTRELVAESGLVLGLSREHRSAAISLFPRANRYAFTLREFARLAVEVPSDELADTLGPLATTEARLAAAVSLVAAHRGLSERPTSPDDDDVVDPYRRDAATYEACGRQLFPAADAVGRFLRSAAVG